MCELAFSSNSLLAFLIFYYRGTFYFFGGLLLIIGMVMEWIIGNTFISVVFGAYGAFWLTYGATLTPGYNALNAYTEGLSGDALTEAMAAYHSTFGIPPIPIKKSSNYKNLRMALFPVLISTSILYHLRRNYHPLLRHRRPSHKPSPSPRPFLRRRRTYSDCRLLLG